MTLTRSGSEVAEYFRLLEAEEAGFESRDHPISPRFNQAPSQDVAAIVANREGVRRLAFRRWGLVPSWSKDPAIAARPSMPERKRPTRSRAFDRPGRSGAVSSRQGSLLGLAGLYEDWLGVGGEIIESCTVLTTEANADLEGVHHRMPVILAPSDFATWLDPASDPGIVANE
jgi:putative SOS response-associated peptidase YedK